MEDTTDYAKEMMYYVINGHKLMFRKNKIGIANAKEVLKLLDEYKVTYTKKVTSRYITIKRRKSNECRKNDRNNRV